MSSQARESSKEQVRKEIAELLGRILADYWLSKRVRPKPPAEHTDAVKNTELDRSSVPDVGDGNRDTGDA